MSSKQDESFFRGFYFMISALVVLTIAITFIATQVYRGYTSSQQTEAEIADRIRPVGQVNVSGEKLSVATSEAPTSEAEAAAPAAPGEAVYRRICFTCHEQGIAGAPKVGDPEAWAARTPKGVETLLQSVINGMTGPNGVMLPRGGMADLTDAELEAAVGYMIGRLPDPGGA
jgi:cytochrome c5